MKKKFVRKISKKKNENIEGKFQNFRLRRLILGVNKISYKKTRTSSLLVKKNSYETRTISYELKSRTSFLNSYVRP